MSAVPSVSPSVNQAPAALGADAAHGLFERHAGKLYAFCLSRLGRREEAEDAVQSTFLNAFRALRRGVVPQAETAWLYKIAGNVCLERQRRSRRRPEIVQNPATLERSAPSTTNGGDELLGLDDALQRLAPRQRRALLLREWHGLSYREIAAELQLSPAAVETLLFRARRSLAQNLDSPQRLRSRRRVPGLQAGSLVAWLKSLLGGVGSAEGRGGGCRGRRHGLGRERTSGTRCASAGGQVDSQTRRHGDHRVAAAAWSIPPSFGGGCCKTRGRAASGTDRPPRQATDACAAHLERRCADDAANGCHACEQTDAGTTG